MPYADPNEMAWALLRAAADAGLRITLLDTCYLTGGLSPDGSSRPLDGRAAAVRRRDREPVGGTGGRARPRRARVLGPGARIGAAIHSVRAVPADQMPEIMAWSHRLAAPVHAHLSEQPAENEAALAAYGRTPTQVLYEAGALGPRSTMVHATHLTAGDIELLGGTQHHRAASARRPRPTWPTGSGRPGRWPRPALRSAWAATATPPSTCWPRPAGWS